MHVEQPPDTVRALSDAVAAVESPFRLAGLHTLTTLTGSLLIALAVLRGRLSPAEAWDAPMSTRPTRRQSGAATPRPRRGWRSPDGIRGRGRADRQRLTIRCARLAGWIAQMRLRNMPGLAVARPRSRLTGRED